MIYDAATKTVVYDSPPPEFLAGVAGALFILPWPWSDQAALALSFALMAWNWRAARRERAS